MKDHFLLFKIPFSSCILFPSFFSSLSISHKSTHAFLPDEGGRESEREREWEWENYRDRREEESKNQDQRKKKVEQQETHHEWRLNPPPHPSHFLRGRHFVSLSLLQILWVLFLSFISFYEFTFLKRNANSKCVSVTKDSLLPLLLLRILSNGLCPFRCLLQLFFQSVSLSLTWMTNWGSVSDREEERERDRDRKRRWLLVMMVKTFSLKTIQVLFFERGKRREGRSTLCVISVFCVCLSWCHIRERIKVQSRSIESIINRRSSLSTSFDV